MEWAIWLAAGLAAGFVVGALVFRHNAKSFEAYAAKFDEEVARVKADAQKQIDALKK